ncbi:MAG: LutC/YkgG family protein [Terriglobia bacterium]
MSSREEMLARVRQALDRPAPGSQSRKAVFPEIGRVLAPIAPGELVERFEAEVIAVAGAAHRAGSAAELQQILLEILPPAANGPVVLSRNPLLTRLEVPQKLEALNYAVARCPDRNELLPDDWASFRRQCFSALAGITGADFALAESGSLVLSSATEGSQLASLAPPIHIAFYTRAQVVESLEEVLRQLPVVQNEDQEMSGRSVVFITGPSRTSDIEQVSIRGVHGPTHVHAILIEGACFG